MAGRRKIFIYNDAELAYPTLTRLVRELASNVAVELSLSSTDWHDYLVDLQRDLDVVFLDGLLRIVGVDLSVFEYSDQQIDSGEATRIEERIAEWFDYITRPVPENVTPYILPQTQERFRAMASLLIAAYPNEAAGWPRLIAANDNIPTHSLTANDNERQLGAMEEEQ